jgi:CoA:oxalate CoA-transferase
VRALDGVLVADLTHAVAGPFCTRQLALLGARVVKVERPDGGDDFRERPRTFDALNAGKRSVALDLRDPAGRDRFLELAARSDVVVENFRPGVMDGLGLAWERLRGVNPRLVYCSISGFGATSDVPAVEWSVQAASGMTAGYVDLDGDPLRLGLSVLDPFTGYMAFARILAALRVRDRTGRGARLDVAMLDAAFTLMWPQVVETLAGGGSRLGRRGTMARFQTADGPMFIGALHQRWFEALCREIGAVELLEDSRFADAAARAAHPDELHAALSRRLAGISGRELEGRLHRLGIAAAAVLSLEEAAALPAVAERGLLDGVNARGPALGADNAGVLG